MNTLTNYCKNCRHLDKETCDIANKPIEEVVVICKDAGWKETGWRKVSDSKSTGDWAVFLEENR